MALEKEHRVEYEKTNLYDSPIDKTLECGIFKGFLEDTKSVKFDALGYCGSDAGTRLRLREGNSLGWGRSANSGIL